jgi:hypothetical protein
LASLYNAAGAKDLAVLECKLLLSAVPNYPDRVNIEKFIAENTVPK